MQALRLAFQCLLVAGLLFYSGPAHSYILVKGTEVPGASYQVEGVSSDWFPELVLGSVDSWSLSMYAVPGALINQPDGAIGVQLTYDF